MNQDEPTELKYYLEKPSRNPVLDQDAEDSSSGAELAYTLNISYFEYLVKYLIPLLTSLLKKYHDLQELQIERDVKGFLERVFVNILGRVSNNDLAKVPDAEEAMQVILQDAHILGLKNAPEVVIKAE